MSCKDYIRLLYLFQVELELKTNMMHVGNEKWPNFLLSERYNNLAYFFFEKKKINQTNDDA